VECASLAIVLISFGVAGVAAYLWWRSSKADISPMWARRENGFEPVVRELADNDRIQGLVQGLTDAAGLNKNAAIWTGISVGLNAVATLLPHLKLLVVCLGLSGFLQQ
jgi:hypothetical protein